MMPKNARSLLLSCALLQACGGARLIPAAPPVQQPPPTVSPRPTAPLPVPEARVLQLPGLEGVIGADAAALLQRFGPPRIDLAEGDARKLQFAGSACVLDIYLYPTSGGDLRATHVAARRASDGQDVDRAGCIAALSQR